MQRVGKRRPEIDPGDRVDDLGGQPQGFEDRQISGNQGAVEALAVGNAVDPARDIVEDAQHAGDVGGRGGGVETLQLVSTEQTDGHRGKKAVDEGERIERDREVRQRTIGPRRIESRGVESDARRRVGARSGDRGVDTEEVQDGRKPGLETAVGPQRVVEEAQHLIRVVDGLLTADDRPGLERRVARRGGAVDAGDLRAVGLDEVLRGRAGTDHHRKVAGIGTGLGDDPIPDGRSEQVALAETKGVDGVVKIHAGRRGGNQTQRQRGRPDDGDVSQRDVKTVDSDQRQHAQEWPGRVDLLVDVERRRVRGARAERDARGGTHRHAADGEFPPETLHRLAHHHDSIPSLTFSGLTQKHTGNPAHSKGAAGELFKTTMR